MNSFKSVNNSQNLNLQLQVSQIDLPSKFWYPFHQIHTERIYCRETTVRTSTSASFLCGKLLCFCLLHTWRFELSCRMILQRIPYQLENSQHQWQHWRDLYGSVGRFLGSSCQRYRDFRKIRRKMTPRNSIVMQELNSTTHSIRFVVVQ